MDLLAELKDSPNKTLEIDAPRSRRLFLNSEFYVRSVASQLIRSLQGYAHSKNSGFFDSSGTDRGGYCLVRKGNLG